MTPTELKIGAKIPCVGGPLDGQTKEYQGGIGLQVTVRARAPKVSGPNEPIDFGEYKKHYYNIEQTAEGIRFVYDPH